MIGNVIIELGEVKMQVTRVYTLDACILISLGC